MPDKTLTCSDCKQPFTFTARDQEFFKKMGFTDPKRCPPCRKIAKSKRERALPQPVKPADIPYPTSREDVDDAENG